MDRSSFVYVTYIRTTPERLWSALTDKDFIPRYWFGVTLESDWRKDSPWRMVFPAGDPSAGGEVLEADPPRRLVLSWNHQSRPDFAAEITTRCTIQIDPVDSAVKLTILHESDKPGSLLIGAVSDGWPKIIANLKSLLETGELVLPFKS